MKLRFSTLFFFLSSTFAFSQTINVFPTIIDFSIGQTGTTQTQSLNITNNSQKSQAVRVYFGDWIRKENGSHEYFEPGSQPFSCANWLSLNTNFAEIPAGGSVQITVSALSPTNQEELEAMKWAMLFIESTEVKEKIEDLGEGVRTKINEIMRIGIHIYQNPPSITKLEAKLESLKPSESNENQYDITILNSGQKMVRTKSYLELTNIDTGVSFHSEIEECPIFPLGKRIVSLQLPAELPKGKYSMLGILDFGDPNSLEAIERIVEIK